jgi:drug/metabolite transporter (DMT)-like permease
MNNFNASIRGIGFMMVGGSLYSLNDAFTKLLTSNYSIVEIMFFIHLFSLLPLLFLITRSQGLKIFQIQRIGPLLLRSVFGCAAVGCFIYSFSILPLADAYVISFIAPLFMALLSAPFLNEKVGKHQWYSVVIGFSGVLIMMRPGTELFEITGFIALLGSFCYAVSLILTRKCSLTENNFMIFLSFTVTNIISAGIFLPFNWKIPLASDLGLLLASGLLTYFSQMALTQAFRLAPASVVGPFDYAALIWACLLGYMIWGDLPDIYCISGACLVMLSGLYLIFKELKTTSFKALLSYK